MVPLEVSKSTDTSSGVPKAHISKVEAAYSTLFVQLNNASTLGKQRTNTQGSRERSWYSVL